MIFLPAKPLAVRLFHRMPVWFVMGTQWFLVRSESHAGKPSMIQKSPRPETDGEVHRAPSRDEHTWTRQIRMIQFAGRPPFLCPTTTIPISPGGWGWHVDTTYLTMEKRRPEGQNGNGERSRVGKEICDWSGRQWNLEVSKTKTSVPYVPSGRCISHWRGRIARKQCVNDEMPKH
jgi:hypothetical protein